jgi:hypothetical protein
LTALRSPFIIGAEIGNEEGATMALPKLPIGISSLEVLRKDAAVYVDKTDLIYQLVTEGRYYFLSRPRRFGKSLLVSTLKCLFEGQRELFDGLWIARHGDWDWQPHPVVHLDFNEISHDTPERLTWGLTHSLRYTAEVYGITLEDAPLKEQFKALLLALQRGTGQPVVVLIDEYDKPIIDHLGQGEARLQVAEANRAIQKQFFGVLKGGTVMDVLRLVFITGISRFSRMSIFSELNNLIDLTMHARYATLLGYTHEEVACDFAPHLERFAASQDISYAALLSRFADYYNGYRFSKKAVTVYNPFSTLRALDEQDFGQYWFETGTPTFLINLLWEKEFPLPQIEALQSTENVFASYDIRQLSPEALLFQTGYVTIKYVQGRLYTFGYPNLEVKNAFLEMLLHAWLGRSREPSDARFLLLAQYLQEEDFASFFETVQAIFASIPYDIQTKRDEAYYHTLFYLMVSASGMWARSSPLTCRGRIDMVVELPDKVYIMEFKCNQSADTALQQIREQGYADPYRQSGKRIILMGINFSTEERNLAGWQVAEV